MIFFACVPAGAAQSDSSSGLFSGAYLQELCASKENGKEKVKGGHTACQAYIAGIVDYHKLMRSLGTQPLMDICVPSTAPMKRLQNIVWVYLAKNPQHGEFMASPSVTMALSCSSFTVLGMAGSLPRLAARPPVRWLPAAARKSPTLLHNAKARKPAKQLPTKRTKNKVNDHD